MKTFLEQVADTFYSEYGGRMSDFCYVFPNKRCCIFFEQYIRSIARGNAFIPKTADIDSFVMKLTRSVVPPHIELLFILYESYKEVVHHREGNFVVSFDSFSRWAEMALADFDDIDRSLVNAKEILTNTDNLKSISSDYLTDEQIQIINQYFNRPIIHEEKHGHMWNHYVGNEDNNDSVIGRYVAIWSVLHDVYTDFKCRLKADGVAYSGMAYRDAAENFDLYKSRLRHRKYIFTGFNAISESEKEIFRKLRECGMGDYYWDCEGIFLTAENPGASFVLANKAAFPSELKLSEIEPYVPEITFVGVPSRIGQTKAAVQILHELKDSGHIGDEGVKTAVVLPDEKLCTYMQRSITEDLEPVNITMGYPMSNTPVTTLIKKIISVRHSYVKRDGDYSYYFKDVLSLLSHPLLMKIKPAATADLADEIYTNHYINITRGYILNKYPELANCFITEDEDVKSIYIIEDFLEEMYSALDDDHMTQAFVICYQKSLDIVKRLCNKYSIELSQDTLLQILHRLASSEKTTFVGEPLVGIQIMGVLETRALDFENLVMLSMNEKIYPHKLFRKSLIPPEIRVAYGLTTTETQENIFAYYFYRLLSRAHRAYFIFDSRSTEASSEMSRYLYQLKYIFGAKIGDRLHERMMAYTFYQPQERDFELKKVYDDDASKMIMERIRCFTPDVQEDKRLYLSASALKDLIHCPLQFFLKHVAGLKIYDDNVNFVDDSMYGTIMHAAFENMYKSLKGEYNISIFDEKTLKNLKERHVPLIEHSLICSFNDKFFNGRLRPADGDFLKVADLQGEYSLLGDIMLDFMLRVIDREIENLHEKGIRHYEYLDSEHRFSLSMKVGKHSVNIKGFIDRLDKVTFLDGSQSLRLIDYKTGSDETEFKLEKGLDEWPGAIFQLLVYCNAYRQENHFDGSITPMIYKIRTMAVKPIDYLVCSGVPLIDYNTINESFLEKFEELLDELFDPNIPFKRHRVAKKDSCRYCDFDSICAVDKTSIY